eukprot:1737524-Pleurochrysis_carterae.AAC.2
MDDARVQARDVALFVGAAGGNLEAADAVANVIAEAVAPGEAGAAGYGGVRGAASEACLRAPRGAGDALGVEGAAKVAREARAFRQDLGVPASAGARGTFVARALMRAAARQKGHGGA